MDQTGVVRLRKDSKSIFEAAKTISLAFSNDPLIQWLRPHGIPWVKLDRSSMKWQRRRVRTALHEGMVLSLDGSHRPPKNTHKFGKHGSELCQIIAVDEKNVSDFAAVAIVEPPRGEQQRSWKFIISWIQLKLLNLFSPAVDVGGELARVETMMRHHDQGLAEITQQLYPKKPWYIEVMAVRPNFHGQGLGRTLLEAIIAESDGGPLVLECTDRQNIGFYQKFGFEEYKSVTLCDGNDAVSYTLMVKR